MNRTIQEYLKDYGYGYDVVVPTELFERQKAEELHESKLALPKDGPTYRDDRKHHSVHVTDTRGVERGEKKGGVIVGHLEVFNPEHHPVLHALVDYPLWWWKNRILEKNNL